MSTDFQKVYDALRTRAEAYGIRVGEASLPAEQPGRFDGLSITMNRDYDPQQRCWYFAHAVGSIVRFSLEPGRCEQMFDELRGVKKSKPLDRERLERAIERYRAYESETSHYAVWLLSDLHYEELVPAYTNFARADLEALTLYHRHGKMPVWQDFFADWNRKVARGEQAVPAFPPHAIPPFQPVKMPEQEVIQEQDGRA